MPKYLQKFRTVWLKDPIFKDWLTSVKSIAGIEAKCKFCGKIVTSRYADLKSHGESKKHKSNADVFLEKSQTKISFVKDSKDNLCSKLEVNGGEIFDSPQEMDESFSNIQIESLSQNCPSPPKTLKIKSPGIKRKTFDEAIGTFYKTLNSSFDDLNANLDDCDEAFGLYLAKELKNIKDISIKKKVKLKVMNIVLYADDSTDENNSQRPFPIFVSTSGNISFSKVNKTPSSNKEL